MVGNEWFQWLICTWPHSCTIKGKCVTQIAKKTLTSQKGRTEKAQWPHASALVFEGSSPGGRHCYVIVFLGKTLNPQSASLQPGV